MRRFVLIAMFITGSVASVMAQTDAKAKSILAEVSKKYRSYDVIKTDFTFTLDNPQAKVKETQVGTLYAKSKANKYKVVLKAQELISDGRNQWTYSKADKEVQLSEVDNSPNALNPAQIFTIYEKGNFKTGACILEESKVVVVNKFSNVESKINSLAQLLQNIQTDESMLDEKQKQFLYVLKQTSLQL